MIYLDNASTTFPKPPAVIQAAIQAMETFANPSRGTHSGAMAALRAVEGCRDDIAQLFNCQAERVAFTSNATEAINIAVASMDGHIITTESEHNAVLRPLYRHGNISIARVDERGRYDVDDIARERRPDTVAVCIAHGANLTGNIHPITEIGRWCRENDLFFIADTAQTAGLVDIDMETMAIDALCFSGHKSLYGMQGTGGICVGERFPARPFMVGGTGLDTFSKTQPEALPTRLEAGTLNGHGIAALAAAVGYIRKHGPESLRTRGAEAASILYEAVVHEHDIVTYGDFSGPRLPMVALNIADMDSSEVAGILSEEYDIAIRAGAHCAPLMHERLGTVRQGAARFSFSHMNSREDALRVVEAVLTIRDRYLG